MMDIVSENDNHVKDAKPSTTNDQNLQTHQITISCQNSISSDISESSLESVLTEKDDEDDIDTANQGEGGGDRTAMPQQSPRIIIPGGYDPARIPGSVFGASPMEWSFASNESLFSLHMGNTSFSKDHLLLSMYKSGELTKFEQELGRFSGVMSSDQYNLGSEGFDQSYAEGLSKEGDRFDWTYDVTPPTFQFPVLIGGYDGTMVTSPTMEPERHWMTETNHESRPLERSDEPQRVQVEAKRHHHHHHHHHHHASNWLFCFTSWFKPCRGCMAYLKH